MDAYLKVKVRLQAAKTSFFWKKYFNFRILIYIFLKPNVQQNIIYFVLKIQ